MTTILSLQMLPIAGMADSCTASDVSCPSDVSCRSAASCVSETSTPVTQLLAY